MYKNTLKKIQTLNTNIINRSVKTLRTSIKVSEFNLHGLNDVTLLKLRKRINRHHYILYSSADISKICLQNRIDIILEASFANNNLIINDCSNNKLSRENLMKVKEVILNDKAPTM